MCQILRMYPWLLRVEGPNSLDLLYTLADESAGFAIITNDSRHHFTDRLSYCSTKSSSQPRQLSFSSCVSSSPSMKGTLHRGAHDFTSIQGTSGTATTSVHVEDVLVLTAHHRARS